MTRFSKAPIGPSPEIARPAAHLRRPAPLVVDLDAGFLTGLPGAGFDANAVMVSRPGWDLIRLQRRFRGRILVLSATPVDVAVWAAELLGVGNSLISVPSGATKAQVVAAQIPVQGFDMLGDAQAMDNLAAARRLWVIGRDENLKRRMLTLGRQLYLLDDSDRFPLAQLAVPGASSWGVGASTVSGGWSNESAQTG